VTDSGDFVADPKAKRLHDLRQPLASIMAAASALRLRADLSGADRESLVDVIIHNAERLAALLEEPGSS
jgi:signal transduction histidine kinase